MITIAWRENQGPEEIHSVDRLLSLLREIASETSDCEGIGFDIQKTSGESLLVIVAGDRWWFTWFPADYPEHGTGSFHSTSIDLDSTDPKALETTDVIPYFYFGHHGEVIRKEGVDDPIGITTISEFFSKPGRSSSARWLPD